MNDAQIRLALPSKGRMEAETLEFLEGCGLRVDKRNPRQYTATLPALPGVLVLFQRARDIPVSVAAGDVDLGITGYDTLAETADPDSDAIVIIHDALGYGECSLVIAVPDDWADVQTARDLARRSEEFRLRVATKYPQLVGRFLEQAGASSVRVVSVPALPTGRLTSRMLPPSAERGMFCAMFPPRPETATL